MTWDLLAAGAVVLLAFGWLIYRKKKKKSKAAQNSPKGSHDCADGCDGCPMRPDSGDCPSTNDDIPKQM